MCKIQKEISEGERSRWVPVYREHLKKCFGFWRRYDNNIIQSLKLAILNTSHIKSDPRTPTFKAVNQELLKEFCKYYRDIVDDLQKKVDDGTYDENKIRVCSICGLPMHEGYYLSGEYACDDKCCLDYYHGNKEQMEEELSHVDDSWCDTYWTEWENVCLD